MLSFPVGKFQNMRLVYGRAARIGAELMNQSSSPIENSRILDDPDTLAKVHSHLPA